MSLSPSILRKSAVGEGSTLAHLATLWKKLSSANTDCWGAIGVLISKESMHCLSLLLKIDNNIQGIFLNLGKILLEANNRPHR